MLKIDISELDKMLKSSADVPPNGTAQTYNPEQLGTTSAKPPFLRQFADKAVSATSALAGGTAAAVAGLSKMKTTLPMKEVE